MSSSVLWQKCIFCQQETKENLICPLSNPVVSQRETAYSEILSLASQFKAVGIAPHPDLELPDQESMTKNRVSWHSSCRRLYRPSLLANAKKTSY